MNTDRIQAEALAARVADPIDALIWPTVTYGYYPAFAAYAGSCTLSESTFEAMIGDSISALIGYGCKAVFLLDTGISTITPVERVLGRLASDCVCHLKIHDGPRYKAAVQKLAQQDYGSHADEMETSLMLALAPDALDLARAEASPAKARDARGPLTPSDAASPGYSRSGSFGDPTLATRAKGEVLLAAMTDDILESARMFLQRSSMARSGRAS